MQNIRYDVAAQGTTITVTGIRTGKARSQCAVSGRDGHFFSPQPLHRLWGPPILRVMGIGEPLPKLTWHGLELHCSSSTKPGLSMYVSPPCNMVLS